MAFQYTNTANQTYILHRREAEFKNGRTQVIYFFAKAEKEESIDEVPEGYEVSETKNGLPVLKQTKQRND